MNTLYQPYVKRVRRALPLLLVASLVGSLIAYGVVSRSGPVHEVHFSYLISMAEQKPVEEFQFDGFYALQATNLFATTLAQWLTTPEVITQAFVEAGLPQTTSSARRLRRFVVAENSAPQLVEVTIRANDPTVATRLADGLMTVMERNIALYHDQTVPALTFTTTTTQPWLGLQPAATRLIPIATFLAILILGINAVLIAESFNEVPGRRSQHQHRVT